MYLFLYFIIYFTLVFVLRSYLLWKKTKVNPLTFKNGDDTHGYNGKLFTFISILELLIVSLYAFAPDYEKYLLPFWYLEHEISLVFGWVLLFGSLIMVWVAQSHMRNSWRIGIDTENSTKLVTKGFFSISRNPIFLGVMIANVGLFLVLPNAFTLLILSLSITSINTQIRLEEEFLTKVFGEEYKTYCRKVRRWL